MKTRIMKIGNSRGIRIPKAMLKRAGLADEVEMVVRGNQIVIGSSTIPRQGWEEAFKRMARLGDDRLIDNDEAPGNPPSDL